MRTPWQIFIWGVFCVQIAWAQAPQADTVVVSLWEPAHQQWFPEKRYVKVQPSTVLSQLWDAKTATWKPWVQTSEARDDRGLVVRRVIQNWHRDHFENALRTEYIYDSRGLLHEQVEQEWYDGRWRNQHRELSTYDGAGLLLERVTQEVDAEGNWVYQDRFLYEYKNKTLCWKVSRFSWDQEWRERDMLLNRFDKQGRKVLSERYVDDGLGLGLPFENVEYEYDVSGKPQAVRRQLVLGAGKQGVSDREWHYLYNEGDCVQEQWETDGEGRIQKRELTSFDKEGRITEQRIFQSNSKELLVPRYKWEYRYRHPVSPSRLGELSPALGMLTFPDLPAGNYRLHLLDLSGREIARLEGKDSAVFNLLANKLSPGLYVYFLDEVQSGKIFRQGKLLIGMQQ